jgi:hypothetical protein
LVIVQNNNLVPRTCCVWREDGQVGRNISSGILNCKLRFTLMQSIYHHKHTFRIGRFPPFLLATKTLRDSRGIALLCFYTSALEGGEGSTSRPGRFLPPRKDPVPIVQEAGWVPGPVWTGAENLAPTVIRSPDRPSRSQSLYRLSYPVHTFRIKVLKS